MNIKLLTKNHLEFLSLKGGCSCSSESIHVGIPHCYKSHATAQISDAMVWRSEPGLITTRLLQSNINVREGRKIRPWHHKTSVVVDLVFIVAPIVCCALCLVLVFFVQYFVPVSFTIILIWKRVIRLFSYSTQLSTKFILLINVKMPTTVSNYLNGTDILYSGHTLKGINNGLFIQMLCLENNGLH